MKSNKKTVTWDEKALINAKYRENKVYRVRRKIITKFEQYIVKCFKQNNYEALKEKVNSYTELNFAKHYPEIKPKTSQYTIYSFKFRKMFLLNSGYAFEWAFEALDMKAIKFFQEYLGYFFRDALYYNNGEAFKLCIDSLAYQLELGKYDSEFAKNILDIFATINPEHFNEIYTSNYTQGNMIHKDWRKIYLNQKKLATERDKVYDFYNLENNKFTTFER